MLMKSPASSNPIARFAALFAALSVAVLAPMGAAQAEDLGSYLTRLNTVCSQQCLSAAEFREAVRSPSPSGKAQGVEDPGVILHVTVVARKGRLYELNLMFDTSPSNILVEFDRDVLADLIDRSRASHQPADGQVSAKTPSLAQADSLFRNRLIAVRGDARFGQRFNGPGWSPNNGTQRGHEIRIRVEDADDIVILPRFDEDGNPVFDGPLARLAAN